MSGMKIIEGLQEAVAHSRGDLSLRGIIEAIINVDSQEPTDYRRLAGRIAARMSGEIDRLTRDLAETRAERDAARAVPEELRQFSEVAHKGRLVFSDIYDQRFARAAATWVRALIAALGSATPPATPTASVQAGERMHHNQFATDLVRAEALEEAANFGWPDGLSGKLEAIAEEIISLGVSPSMLGTLCGAMEEAIALYATAVRALATRGTGTVPAEPAADRDGGGGE